MFDHDRGVAPEPLTPPTLRPDLAVRAPTLVCEAPAQYVEQFEDFVPVHGVRRS